MFRKVISDKARLLCSRSQFFLRPLLVRRRRTFPINYKNLSRREITIHVGRISCAVSVISVRYFCPISTKIIRRRTVVRAPYMKWKILLLGLGIFHTNRQTDKHEEINIIIIFSNWSAKAPKIFALCRCVFCGCVYSTPFQAHRFSTTSTSHTPPPTSPPPRPTPPHPHPTFLITYSEKSVGTLYDTQLKRKLSFCTFQTLGSQLDGGRTKLWTER